MTLGTILLFLASIGALIAWIWFIVVAFQQDEKVWGILLIVGFVIAPLGPFVVLAFLALKWSLVRRPGMIFLGSFVAMILGTILVITGAKQAMEEALGPEGLAAIKAEAARAAREGGKPVVSPEPPAPSPAPSPMPAPAAAPPDHPPVAAPRTARPAPARPVPPPDSPAPASVDSRPPPPPSPESLNPQVPPARVQLVELGETSPNQLRTLRLRVINDAKLPIRELKLDLAYLDARGGRLGTWTTVHTSSEPLAGAGATNEFDMQAFFVPQFTKGVRLDVRAITFGDDSRWPAAH